MIDPMEAMVMQSQEQMETAINTLSKMVTMFYQGTRGLPKNLRGQLTIMLMDQIGTHNENIEQ